MTNTTLHSWIDRNREICGFGSCINITAIHMESSRRPAYNRNITEWRVGGLFQLKTSHSLRKMFNYYKRKPCCYSYNSCNKLATCILFMHPTLQSTQFHRTSIISKIEQIWFLKWLIYIELSCRFCLQMNAFIFYRVHISYIANQITIIQIAMTKTGRT